MLRESLINLTETVTDKEPMINYKGSLVILSLDTGVARALRMNSFEPIFGWRG
jgi:hypothetical protein